MFLNDFFAPLIAFITLTLSILAYAELWQRKEYRWDRTKTYLTSPESRGLLIPYTAGATLTLASALAVRLSLSAAALALGWAALLTYAGYQALRTYRRGVFRPVMTTKAITLVLTTAITVAFYRVLVFKPTWPDVLDWASLLTFLPILTLASGILVNIPFTLRKKTVIAKARTLRTGLPNLTVIGITGSYGKTSTKNFLQQLLPEAAATKEHRNSDIAVAQDMLTQLTQKTRTYIAEMGAYTKGEIAAVARITQPRIGVITAIGNQHAALFGSQENILVAKWELIDALPADGIAVLNTDDPLLKQRSATYPGKIVWYSATQPADIYASNIHINPENITCTLHIAELQHNVTIPLASDGLLSSVLAAVAAAHAYGTSDELISKCVQQLQPFPQTMELRTGKNGATIIDDSYSASEHGVINALNHLKRFPQKDKRIVLLPLIELGTQATAVHHRIGAALAQTGATVYVSAVAFSAALQAGMGTAPLHIQPNPSQLIDALTQNMNENTVILLEGRIPKIVRTAVLAKNDKV